MITIDFCISNGLSLVISICPSWSIKLAGIGSSKFRHVPYILVPSCWVSMKEKEIGSLIVLDNVIPLGKQN